MPRPTVLQIFVHGTDDLSSLTQIDSSYFPQEFKRRMAAAYESNNYNVLQTNFDWGNLNSYLHQSDSRTTAANELAYKLDTTLKNLQKQGKLPKDLRVALIGHSHGGNVCIQSLKYLKNIAAKYGVNLTVDLMTLNTPTYTARTPTAYTTGPDGFPIPTNFEINIEDPRRYINQATLGNNVKVNHFQAGVSGDKVVIAALGGLGYGNNGVTASKRYNNTGTFNLDQHYVIPQVLDSQQSQDYTNTDVPNFVANRPMRITQPQNQPQQQRR
jgi:hypothetical protein